MTTLTDVNHSSYPNPVEYTISQDRGAGNSAQVEAGYVLLAGKDFGVSPYQGQRQKEAADQSHALQDYQMQLMLLECSN